MQIPLLVFEEYVDKFQQKVASLKKQPVVRSVVDHRAPRVRMNLS